MVYLTLVESSQQQRPLQVLCSVKAALLHSIYTGSFVDYRFFAKNSRGLKGSHRPIYLSSIVAGERLHLIQSGARQSFCA